MIFSTIISVVLAIFCILVGYVALPALTLASAGLWCYLLLVAVCIAGAVSLFLFAADYEDKIFIPWLCVVGFALIFAICGIISGHAFHYEKARAVADVTVSEEGISEAFPDLTEAKNRQNLPLVDLDTAKILGDKKVAGLKNASWYDVDDEYNLVIFQGEQYRLSVIDYGGYFKFRKARDFGLPGYVLVSVTPENGTVTQEAQVVTLDEPIRFSPGAYFSKNLRRHLRGQFKSYIFDSSFLEIDEEGNPFWVTGVLRPTAGPFGVKTVTSFILTDAQSGESKEYKISEAPEWVDHIYSLDYLMTIARWHYRYVNGWFNLSKTGVWNTSYEYRGSSSSSENNEAGKFANFFGYSSIVDKDGQVQFYTGLTAANNAESNLGWLTIDTSTGRMTQYEVLGAEESSAQSAVETLVQAQKYEATFPLPANIGGQASYLMLLKGKSGLAQGYAICNVENFSVAVQAETLDKAISAYMAKLTGKEPEPSNETAIDTTETPAITAEKIGRIETIYTADIKGTTYFYFQIDGELYSVPVTVNERMVAFRVGEEVKFVYSPTEDNSIPRILKIDISPD